MTYSDLLATLAIFVSVSVAGWTAYRALRWDRPVVKVNGGEEMIFTNAGLAPTDVNVSMEVFNTGNQATQILEAFWEIEVSGGCPYRFFPRPRTSSDASFPDILSMIPGGGPDGHGGTIDGLVDSESGPELPLRLDRYGHHLWSFEISLEGDPKLSDAVRARPVVEYTSRKTRRVKVGRWQPTEFNRGFLAE